jgi:hypothetical protein
LIANFERHPASLREAKPARKVYSRSRLKNAAGMDATPVVANRPFSQPSFRNSLPGLNARRRRIDHERGTKPISPAAGTGSGVSECGTGGMGAELPAA